MKILVLGGGLSGLTAAWFLTQKNHDVLLWEASDGFGGWAQTLSWPGPRGEPGCLEKGPQGIRWSKGGAVDRLVKSLDLPVRIPPKPTCRWIWKEGRRRVLPRSLLAWLASDLLPPSTRFRMLLEPFQRKAPQASVESLHDLVVRRIGSGFASEILPALMAGFLPADPVHIAASVFPGLERWDRFGGFLWIAGRLAAERNVVPEGGMGSLASTLAARIKSRETGRTVRMLSAIKARGWRAVCADGTSAQADAVLVALPPREAQSLLTVVAPSAAELLGRISMASISTWHSRHPWNCALEEGFNVVADPRESAPWLGASAWRKEDPRGVPGCLQARIHALSGTGSSEPSKEDGWGRLHDWFPELADPIQIRIEKSQEAILLPAPGHGTLTEAIVQGLPPGLHWIGTGRFDPGLTGIIEGVEKWACGFPYG